MGENLKLERASMKSNHQSWYYSKEDEIRIDDACFDYPHNKAGKDQKNKIVTFGCHGSKGNQEFIFKVIS